MRSPSYRQGQPQDLEYRTSATIAIAIVLRMIGGRKNLIYLKIYTMPRSPVRKKDCF